jgi:penicillin amidase
MLNKVFSRIIYLILGLAFAIIIIIYGIVHISKPSNDGKVVVDEILEKVSIQKDQWGIPHIEAKNQHDALFAYGYTVAKDRLFQMDIQRRLARGELSEILGEDLIEIDKMFRTYLISNKAKKYLSDTSKISSDALKYIDAYIQGVNYFIKTGPKTIEHRLIGEEVRPFDRLDVASMTIYMSFSLMDGIRRDMLFSMLKEKISKVDLEIIFPDYADNNFLTIMEEEIDSIPKRNYSNEENMSDSAYKKLISYFDLTEKLTGLVPPFHGSNSWVLSPSRSNSGNAILANDPHIGLSKPDVWYEAHVSYPGYNNYGYYIPTIPFPLIGHDDFKAWGMTMFENDEVDLYKERFNPKNKNQVLFDGKWVNSKVIKEQIKVKDKSQEDLTIRVTSHGPIISDYIDGYTGSPLAFSWVFYNLENPFFDMLYDITTANNITDFQYSVSKVTSPGLNFSYVDKAGNIAWWATGRLPIRDSNINAKSILDGSKPNHNIKSYVSFKNNPQLINPKSGVIITANNLPTANEIESIPRLDGYFRSTDRAHRIYQLLSQQEKWSTEELKKIQNDDFLLSGLSINMEIITALKPFAVQFSNVESKAYELLKKWDGYMPVDSKGASIFQLTIYHVLKSVLEPTLGKDYFRIYMNNLDHWDFFKNFIFKKVVPFQVDSLQINEELRDKLICNGFVNAVNEIKDKLGKDINNWDWGNIHTITYEHPLGKLSPLNYIFNLGPFSIPGANNVINKSMSTPGNHDYKVSSLPSTRRLIDIGSPENSYSILPSGNSGNFWSNHYDDQLNLFLNGKYRKINFSKGQINSNLSHELLLIPN